MGWLDSGLRIIAVAVMLAVTVAAKWKCDTCEPFSSDCTHGMREIMNRTSYELRFKPGFKGELRVYVDGQPTPLFFQQDCMDLRHSLYLFRDDGGTNQRVSRMVETTFWTRFVLGMRHSYFFDCKFQLSEFETVEDGKMFLAVRWFYLKSGHWAVKRDINITTPFGSGASLVFLDLAHKDGTFRGAYEMGQGPSGAVYVVYGQDPITAKAEMSKGDEKVWHVTIFPYERPVNSSSFDPRHDPRFILVTLGYMAMNHPLYSGSCRSLYQGIMYSFYGLGVLLFLAFLLYPHGGEWMVLITYQTLLRLPCLRCLRGRDQKFYANLRGGSSDSKLAFWGDLEEEAAEREAADAREDDVDGDEDDYVSFRGASSEGEEADSSTDSPDASSDRDKDDAEPDEQSDND